MKKKLLLYLIVLIGLSLIAYLLFFRKSSSTKDKENKGPRDPLVQAEGIVAGTGNFENTLILSGSIEADEQVAIRPEVSGKVEKIYFNEGAYVSRGQVLFKINDIELIAQLRQAETRQQLTSENERRARLLLDKGAISREEYDVASADFKTAEAQIQLINAQIAKTVIRAPFSGRIGLRNISTGAFVSPETILTNLVSSSRVKITFPVPEKYLSLLNTRSSIKFTVANSDEVFEAKIYAIEPAVETATRTVMVRALSGNSGNKLVPGTYASVSLPLDDRDVITIPTEAIVPVQDGKKVFIAKEGKAREVKVETGTRTDKDIVVLAGISPGDTVLTTAVLTLKDGARVKVTIHKNPAK